MAITQAIRGLGGVGKSRLAVELAWHAARNRLYRAVFFIIADSPISLDANLAKIAPKIGIGEIKDQEAQLEAVLKWLEQNSGWLLILDNVDTEDAAKAVLELLPRLHRGRVLITSRRRSWPASVPSIELKTLDEESSVRLLLDRAGARVKTGHDEEDARKLARLLDGLPLALEQAAAFIEFKSFTFARYLKNWEADREKVLVWCDKNCGVPVSVAVTWKRTWDVLDSPARTMLRVSAFLSPEPIPEDLFFQGGERLSGARKLLEDAKGENQEFPTAEAISQLSRYSMIERSEHAFTLHRIVQEVIRIRIPEEERKVWLEAALNLVNDYFPVDPPPNDVRSWNRWKPMRPHVAQILEMADKKGIPEPTGRLMNEFGLYLFTRASYKEAEPLYRRVVEIFEKLYGKDHPNVAATINNLAQLLQATNRLKEAEPLMRRVVKIFEKSYGNNHPNVATALNNLALLLQDTNRLKEAEPMMRRVVKILENPGGDPYPNYSGALNNLAQLLQSTNRLKEAEPMMRRALEIDEASYGPDHPNVAIRLGNLAMIEWEKKNPGEARRLLERALTIFRSSFDEDHPYVQGTLRMMEKVSG